MRAPDGSLAFSYFQFFRLHDRGVLQRLEFITGLSEFLFAARCLAVQSSAFVIAPFEFMQQILHFLLDESKHVGHLFSPSRPIDRLLFFRPLPFFVADLKAVEPL